MRPLLTLEELHTLGTTLHAESPAINRYLNRDFTLIQWAAACSDTRVPRPHHVWEKRNKEGFEVLREKLDTQVRLLNLVVDERRRNALVPGTPEFQLLSAKNAEIKAENERRKRAKQRGRLQLFTPERLYPYDKIEMENKAGGVDYVFYTFEYYKDRLFPYVEEIRKLNPYKRVLVTEDNAPCHLKARRLLEPDIRRLGIEFVDWPANSPDLHPIETLDRLQKRFWTVFRAG
jgi:hypothetical protein